MLTHVDSQNLPQMVDITSKDSTRRVAIASAIIKLPLIFKDYIQGKEIFLKKGPVIQTAIIAGTMGVKSTSNIIPFCHPLHIDKCQFNIEIKEHLEIEIQCHVQTDYKTGVEMEALTGASIAALTIYDMCKALSNEIEISKIQLLEKTGGKKDYKKIPTYGLVLTGGKSSRMNQDKALINYKGEAHAKFLFHLLENFCKKTYISSKNNQWIGTELESLPTIYDESEINSPLTGMISAFNVHPEANWFIIACDLPFINQETISKLIYHESDKDLIGHFYKSKEKDFPEALCGLYKPKSFQIIKNHFSNGITCPVKILKKENIALFEQHNNTNLENVNTPEDYKKAIYEKC
jgi:cyclic pyranopterin phosphate synthase